MKKFNAKTLLTSLAAYVIVTAILLAVAGYFLVGAEGYAVVAPIFVIIGAVVGIIIWAISLAWGGSSRKAKKTFEDGISSNNFRNYSTFEASDAFLVIDGESNRIGYVANSNPKQFQMADKNDITDIVSSHIKAPFGGTSGVYFSFKYNGKKTKLYTYLTNGNASLNSNVIIEAVSKADFYAEQLKKRV